MSDRRCGYCRMFGHTKPGCPERLQTIYSIKDHVQKQRIGIVNMLTMNGYGVGGIVEAYNNLSGDYTHCVVTQDSLDSACTNYNHFFSARNVKYHKNVYVVYNNFTGTTSGEPIAGKDIVVWQEYVCMEVVGIKQGVGKLVAAVHVSDLLKGAGSLNPNSNRKATYAWSYVSTLVIPSNDGAISTYALNAPVSINSRLTDGSNTVLRFT